MVFNKWIVLLVFVIHLKRLSLIKRNQNVLQQVLALREKLLNPDAAWGDAGGSPWSGNSAWATPPACSSSVSLSANSSLTTTITTSTTTTSRHQEAPARPPPPSALPEGGKSSGEEYNPLAEPHSTTPSCDAFATSTTTNTFNLSTIHSFAGTNAPSL